MPIKTWMLHKYVVRLPSHCPITAQHVATIHGVVIFAPAMEISSWTQDYFLVNETAANEMLIGDQLTFHTTWQALCPVCLGLCTTARWCIAGWKLAAIFIPKLSRSLGHKSSPLCKTTISNPNPIMIYNIDHDHHTSMAVYRFQQQYFMMSVTVAKAIINPCYFCMIIL